MWVTTLGGKTMPLDLLPSEETGNVLLEVVIGGNPCASVLGTKADIAAARADGRAVYTSHFVTCPDSKGWRK
jgi:hypothetical protein